jgi:isoleucyl-tRNA synthetase
MLKVLEKYRGDSDFLSNGHSTNEVDDLRFVLIVSKVTLVDSEAEVVSKCPSYHVLNASSESKITVGVKLSDGKKCERCWYYSDTVKENEKHDPHEHSDICPRCSSVLKAKENSSK